MRTNLELWLIVEQNFDKYFNKGLCETLFDMMEDGLISGNEKIHICDIIMEYGKRRFKFYYPLIYAEYCWKKWHKKPRKMFIQKQILKELRK